MGQEQSLDDFSLSVIVGVGSPVMSCFSSSMSLVKAMIVCLEKEIQWYLGLCCLVNLSIPDWTATTSRLVD